MGRRTGRAAAAAPAAASPSAAPATTAAVDASVTRHQSGSSFNDGDGGLRDSRTGSGSGTTNLASNGVVDAGGSVDASDKGHRDDLPSSQPALHNAMPRAGVARLTAPPHGSLAPLAASASKDPTALREAALPLRKLSFLANRRSSNTDTSSPATGNSNGSSPHPDMYVWNPTRSFSYSEQEAQLWSGVHPRSASPDSPTDSNFSSGGLHSSGAASGPFFVQRASSFRRRWFRPSGDDYKDRRNSSRQRSTSRPPASPGSASKRSSSLPRTPITPTTPNTLSVPDLTMHPPQRAIPSFVPLDAVDFSVDTVQAATGMAANSDIRPAEAAPPEPETVVATPAVPVVVKSASNSSLASSINPAMWFKRAIGSSQNQATTAGDDSSKPPPPDKAQASSSTVPERMVRGESGRGRAPLSPPSVPAWVTGRAIPPPTSTQANTGGVPMSGTSARAAENPSPVRGRNASMANTANEENTPTRATLAQSGPLASPGMAAIEEENETAASPLPVNSDGTGTAVLTKALNFVFGGNARSPSPSARPAPTAAPNTTSTDGSSFIPIANSNGSNENNHTSLQSVNPAGGLSSSRGLSEPITVDPTLRWLDLYVEAENNADDDASESETNLENEEEQSSPQILGSRPSPHGSIRKRAHRTRRPAFFRASSINTGQSTVGRSALGSGSEGLGSPITSRSSVRRKSEGLIIGSSHGKVRLDSNASSMVSIRGSQDDDAGAADYVGGLSTTPSEPWSFGTLFPSGGGGSAVGGTVGKSKGANKTPFALQNWFITIGGGNSDKTVRRQKRWRKRRSDVGLPTVLDRDTDEDGDDDGTVKVATTLVRPAASSSTFVEDDPGANAAIQIEGESRATLQSPENVDSPSGTPTKFDIGAMRLSAFSIDAQFADEESDEEPNPQELAKRPVRQRRRGERKSLWISSLPPPNRGPTSDDSVQPPSQGRQKSRSLPLAARRNTERPSIIIERRANQGSAGTDTDTHGENPPTGASSDTNHSGREDNYDSYASSDDGIETDVSVGGKHYLVWNPAPAPDSSAPSTPGVMSPPDSPVPSTPRPPQLPLPPPPPLQSSPSPSASTAAPTVPLAFYKYGLYMTVEPAPVRGGQPSPLPALSDFVGGWLTTEFTLYTVTVKLLKPRVTGFRNAVPCSFTVNRRFREFELLYKSLLDEYGEFISDWPHFPSKGYFGRFQPTTIAHRTAAFREILFFVSQHPDLHFCPPLLKFLGVRVRPSSNPIDGHNYRRPPSPTPSTFNHNLVSFAQSVPPSYPTVGPDVPLPGSSSNAGPSRRVSITASALDAAITGPSAGTSGGLLFFEHARSSSNTTLTSAASRSHLVVPPTLGEETSYTRPADAASGSRKRRTISLW
ncbi:hypothetical protein DFJ73DRAFT_121333 [Zopfochytrium polystomum]|nr:hypothetical protein DFJ73DRAFT_121333 [Zopfochytrium polystomum]